MRLIYISGAYLPSRGANAVHVMHQCEAFAAAGHEVTLIARTGYPMPLEEIYRQYGVEQSFRLILVPRLQLRFVAALIWALRVAIRVWRQPRSPDTLIYAREVWALYLSVLLTGQPFIFESHWAPSGVQKWVEGQLTKHSSLRGFVFISQALRDIYAKVLPTLDQGQTLVAHDAAQHRPAPPLPAALNPLQVGYVGSFRAGYGIEQIIALSRARPEMGFTIIGGDPEAIAAMRTRHKTEAIENLTFTGFVAPRTLPEYYSNFDVMLAPYTSETDHIAWISPMKLFEYMAFGKGVLCSDFPVLREIVIEGETGFLLPEKDIEPWLERLDALAADPEQVRQLARGAYAHFEAEHTWNRRGAKILKALLHD